MLCKCKLYGLWNLSLLLHGGGLTEAVVNINCSGDYDSSCNEHVEKCDPSPSAAIDGVADANKSFRCRRAIESVLQVDIFYLLFVGFTFVLRQKMLLPQHISFFVWKVSLEYRIFGEFRADVLFDII